MSKAKFEIKRLLSLLEAELEFKQRAKRTKSVPKKGSRIRFSEDFIDISNGLLPNVSKSESVRPSGR